jgi:outer membrane protein OmpA-like peptidoglycan-associated protein
MSIRKTGMKQLAISSSLTALLIVLPATPPAAAVAQAPPCTRPADQAFGTTKKTELSLEGRIYFLPEKTEKLPDFSKAKSQGSVFADQFDVPPQDFTVGFPGVTNRFEWFAIDYQGTIYVPAAGEYAFKLFSDDGSKLYIDGKVVIDMDRIQGWDLAEGRVKLTQGDHQVRLSYFQGPATQLGLRLLVTPPGSDFERVFRLSDFNKAVAENRRLLGVVENRDEIRIRFGAEVLFDTGKYVLKPLAETALTQLATFLRAYPGFPIVVEGHTDNVGNAASNMTLSNQRAQSVRDWLVNQGHLPAGCMSTKGFGLTEPIADNGTADGRQKNRRVEIKIEKGER